MTILAELASDDVLDTAYEWLCRRRRDYSANADVWSFRRCWSHEKERIKSDLLSGDYRFSLLSRVTLANGDEVDLWSARDALVLKALSRVLAAASAVVTALHPPQGPWRCEACRARGPRPSEG